MLDRPARHSKSITAADVRAILDRALKRQAKKPGPAGMKALAWHLNEIRGAFEFATMIANGSHETARRVRDAVAILMMFFEERDRACRLENPDVRVIEDEKHLRNQFWRFVLAMMAHDFQLAMDAGALTPPMEDNWHGIAELIAGAFRATLSKQQFGLSNDGPVPRFVTAAIPLVTGEEPQLGAVAQYLKRRARERRRKTGTAK